MFLNILKMGLVICVFLSATMASAAEENIPNLDRYFPDEIGLRWTYEGSITEKVQKISTYTTTSIITGTTKKDGVTVQIVSESNRANEGPAESYYSRNEDSIVYHGGEPTSPFEEQLVPYLAMQFPLRIGEHFIQVEKDAVPFGNDLDGDGIEELAKVKAELRVIGFETVSVPAGRFVEALRLDGKMTIVFTLSKDNGTVELIDKTSTWFTLDLGMVKSLETIDLPEVGGMPAAKTVIEENLSVLPKHAKPLN